MFWISTVNDYIEKGYRLGVHWASKMDTIIYLGTAVFTVSWSVWTYLTWSDRARLPENSGLRFLLILGPSAYFLLIALAGWEKVLFLRLDLVGIAAFNALILLSWLALLIMLWLKVSNYKKAYISILIIYNALAACLVSLAHLIKLFPPLLIGFANLVSQGLKFNFFQFAWIGLDPETHEHDLVSMLNKILIALLSYIPISILRALYVNRQVNRQQKKMIEEINSLKEKIREIEQKIPE